MADQYMTFDTVPDERFPEPVDPGLYAMEYIPPPEAPENDLSVEELAAASGIPMGPEPKVIQENRQPQESDLEPQLPGLRIPDVDVSFERQKILQYLEALEMGSREDEPFTRLLEDVTQHILPAARLLKQNQQELETMELTIRREEKLLTENENRDFEEFATAVTEEITSFNEHFKSAKKSLDVLAEAGLQRLQNDGKYVAGLVGKCGNDLSSAASSLSVIARLQQNFANQQKTRLKGIEDTARLKTMKTDSDIKRESIAAACIEKTEKVSKRITKVEKNLAMRTAKREKRVLDKLSSLREQTADPETVTGLEAQIEKDRQDPEPQAEAVGNEARLEETGESCGSPAAGWKEKIRNFFRDLFTLEDRTEKQEADPEDREPDPEQIEKAVEEESRQEEPVREEEEPEEAELPVEREGDPEMVQPSDEERTERPEGLDAAEANEEQEADEEMEREL
ncbi:hypothetical protein [Faecalibaculum rodentium]|uniref:hypothetical protein n=1 Tax=Faecalibaculum rodentium TaxID=1702221 RepID=UPI0023F3994A|nr:hypothetical protein [Faecalibaculum rodentium]